MWKLLGGGLPAAPLATIGSTGASPMISGSQTNLTSPLFGYQPSDRIEMNNVISVSIGSGQSGMGPPNYDDETYIEFVDLTTSPPALRGLQVVVTPTTGGYNTDHAGYANDVAITRDGAWAVVNGDNWIHVFLLASAPAAASTFKFNIGGLDYSVSPPVPWMRPCSPNRAVDSVAVNNDYAVVTTARIGNLGTFTTWVYIIDLNATGGPAIVLQQELTTGGTTEAEEDRPHDVAITEPAPGSNPMAVVTSTHCVGLFDLATAPPRYVTHVVDWSLWRRYQWQVDSVEMTDQRAVVIADWKDPNAPGSNFYWNADVWRLSPTALGNLGRYIDPGSTSQGPETHSHDLAIDKSFDKALVRTSFTNEVITSMVTPPLATWPIPSPNGSDAFAYKAFNQAYGYDAFSSDSVVIVPQVDATRAVAATIGGQANSFGIFSGYVDVLDIGVIPPVLLQQVPIVTADPQPIINGGCVPLDIAAAFNQNEVIVRSADPFPDSAGSLSGADLVRVSLLAPIAIVVQYGGHGTVMGLDSIAAPVSGAVSTTKRVLSIAQEPLTSVGPGYVHIAH